jgi:acrylyl-CoA reductase (NADPH)
VTPRTQEHRSSGAAVAFVVRDNNGTGRGRFERVPLESLGPGEVTIGVRYSSINFKDSLTLDPARRVARLYPLIPGVDLSGAVIDSDVPRLRPGLDVIVQGRGLGTDHHGGFSTVARVPSDWVVPIPAGLNARSTMILGTPALTAMLAVERFNQEGLSPRAGPVVVTAAAGGVGSFAVRLLAERGFDVWASSRTRDAEAYLRRLGASEVIESSELIGDHRAALGHARWAGAVDNVGGATLSALLRTTQVGGVIAVVGHIGGAEVRTTTYPWIVRGILAAGIDTEHVSRDRRVAAWRSLAAASLGGLFDEIAVEEIAFQGLPEALARVHRGEGRGRIIVKVDGVVDGLARS